MSMFERIIGLLGKQGRLCILLTGLLWSLAGAFIKFLDLHPLTITFYRSLFASLFFWLFLRGRASRLNLPLIVSVSSYTAAISAFVWANKLTTAANAIVLQYTAPIFVFIFVRFLFGETISKINLLVLGLGMLGIGVIFWGSAGEPDAAGVLVAVLSGFLFAIFMVNLRAVKRADPVYLTWLNNFACSILLLPFVWSQLSLSFGQASALAVMGVVQLGIPYFLFTKGLETVRLQEASLIVLIEPVLNPIWVALTVGEIPSPATLIGGTIILSSLITRYTASWRDRPRVAHRPPAP